MKFCSHALLSCFISSTVALLFFVTTYSSINLFWQFWILWEVWALQVLDWRHSSTKGWQLFVFNRERCFSSCPERGTKKKILSPHEESNLRPSDFPLRCYNHWTTETPWWAPTTRVLRTARVSNVNSVMFVDRNKRDGKFSFRSLMMETNLQKGGLVHRVLWAKSREKLKEFFQSVCVLFCKCKHCNLF